MPRFDHAAMVPASFQTVDQYVDNFSKAADVLSDRLYGEVSEETPWISVVIPTFNRGTLFRTALESVLGQEEVPFPWEIVVVDNTPLDADRLTLALREIQEIGNPRVLYYHNRENLGSGYNWNRGVQLARGKWICFLHDDDVLCSNALRNVGRQISAYHGKHPIGYIHARRIDFSGEFQVRDFRRFPTERLTRFGVLISGCTGAGSPTCGTAILKQAYLEVGGIDYDYGFSADAVLCYQIMRAYRVVCSDRILGGSRWDENETLRKTTLLQLVQTDELLSSFTYHSSPFASWWGAVFGATSSWRNIHRKHKIAVRNSVNVTKEEFGRSSSYPEPGNVKKGVFLGCYVLYRLLRLADGWCFQKIAFKEEKKIRRNYYEQIR